MKRFSASKVNALDEKRSERKTWITLEDIKKNFHTYDEFEKHQEEINKPIWIQVLTDISGCKDRAILEHQYKLFGYIFHKFHAEHMDWLTNPSLCPTNIKKERERELLKIIRIFTRQRKCHWTRKHIFICYCDEKI